MNKTALKLNIVFRFRIFLPEEFLFILSVIVMMLYKLHVKRYFVLMLVESYLSIQNVEWNGFIIIYLDNPFF